MSYSKLVCLVLICAVLFSTALSQNRSQSKDARAAVTSFFSLLKSQQYAALYDFLPSQLQRQITREQLSLSLKRLESFIAIERLEIGRVQQRGDIAVVDTTIYGRLKKPLNFDGQEVNEGRVTVQQYLFKEGGQWKVATADNRTRDQFLKHNPEFNQQFQLSQPKFEFKQKDKWMAVGRPTKPSRSS